MDPMKTTLCALTLGAVATLVSLGANAHTTAWYSAHLDEAKLRDKACQSQLKADRALTPDEKSDCDNAVVALVTQPPKQAIPKATSAPAPKWKNFGQ
jgi:hypothetical protein